MSQTHPALTVDRETDTSVNAIQLTVKRSALTVDRETGGELNSTGGHCFPLTSTPKMSKLDNTACETISKGKKLMKIVTALGMFVLMLSGCTSVEYQKMQTERDQLLKNYEDLREEHSELKVKTDITDTLLGKWKFLNLEIEEGNVSEEVAETKAALYALDMKHLTLEFFKEKGIYHYRGKNGSTEIFGQFTIFTVRYGDEPFPFIRLIRRSGPEMSQLLFAASSDGKPLGLSSAPGLETAKEISISVTADRLYLTMHGKMQLGPNGWVQSGGVRCYLERVKE